MRMFEIIEGKRNVNNVEITTWKREIFSANILEVEVGTTGFCGGDTGHGGRTYFRLADLGSTDMNVSISNYQDNPSVTIELGGDTELETFIDALKFAVQVLESEKNAND